MNKLKVSVLIPVYKSEKNIAQLLASLVKQDTKDFILQEIIVYSDGNTDGTIIEIKKVSKLDKRILLMDAKNRRGMAAGLKIMLSKAKGDVFLLLNDDILITDKKFIYHMVKKFQSISNVGIIGGNPLPISTGKFFNKAQISAFNAYDAMRISINNGNNKYTCDGKVLLISRSFYDKIVFPKDNSLLGCVDVYLYMYNKKLGLNYLYSRDSIVYFDLPNTLKDYIKWTTRNNSNKTLLRDQFGDIVDVEYYMPTSLYIRTFATQFISNPVGCVFLFIIGRYSKFRANHKENKFEPMWDVVSSTKNKLTTNA